MSSSPQSPVRVALFGCGRMGQVRADLFARLGARVAFAFDVDHAAAERSGAIVLSSPEALDLAAIDALFVCTPPGSRGAVEREALRRGVAVFFEKPIAIDAAAAQTWVDAARRGNAVTAVGYMNRYRSAVGRAVAVAREEGIVVQSGAWASGEYARTWWKDPRQSGGPVNEQATHLVDLMRAIGGEVRSVSSVGTAAVEPDRATDVATALEFTAGHVGTIVYSCRAREKGISLRLVTPRRSVALEGWDFRDALTPEGENPFFAETAAFLAAVRSPAAPRPRVDFVEALKTQRVVDAIKSSLRSGARIAVPTD